MPLWFRFPLSINVYYSFYYTKATYECNSASILNFISFCNRYRLNYYLGVSCREKSIHIFRVRYKRMKTTKENLFHNKIIYLKLNCLVAFLQKNRMLFSE